MVLDMDAAHVEHDLVNILFTEKQIQDRLDELAAADRAPTTRARTSCSSASCAAR